MNAIEAFLKKAGTSKGLEEAKSQFIMMEDPPDEIVACLGMEEFENKKGLCALVVFKLEPRPHRFLVSKHAGIVRKARNPNPLFSSQ